MVTLRVQSLGLLTGESYHHLAPEAGGKGERPAGLYVITAYLVLLCAGKCVKYIVSSTQHRFAKWTLFCRQAQKKKETCLKCHREHVVGPSGP